MKRLLAIQFIVLAVFVLLGNGIRSVAMSTVLVSQAEFASFLNISAERTDMLIEALMGGSLLALALAPFLIAPGSAMRLARNAAILAVVCYGAIGATMHANPALLTREVIIISAFAAAGFAVAFFAPLAQLAIGQANDERSRGALTTLWTAAQPIAMLATPQLVKYVAFDIGVGNFFFVLAALPVVFLILVPLVFPRTPHEGAVAATPIPWRRLAGFLLLLLLFEVSTISISMAGILGTVTLSLLAAMSLAGLALFLRRRHWVDPSFELPAGAGTLMGLLFLIQVPSTGLYDSAYLVRHLCSTAFIADRATFGAIAQICGVFGAGALLLRWPQGQYWLLWLSLVLTLLGSAMMMLYPYRANDELLFIASKALLSGGVGIGTVVLVRAILAASGGNRMVIMAPAFLILFGTEVGMETLEIIFQITQLGGFDANTAFENVFFAQVVATLVAMGVLGLGNPRFGSREPAEIADMGHTRNSAATS
jgi:hypothetical protein